MPTFLWKWKGNGGASFGFGGKFLTEGHLAANIFSQFLSCPFENFWTLIFVDGGFSLQCNFKWLFWFLMVIFLVVHFWLVQFLVVLGL